MKANELSCKDLMVGDLVSYHGIVNKVAPADFCQKAWIEEIKPIPLTPEILEKNGFKLNPQGSYSIGRNVSIDILDGHYNANINTDNPQVPSFLYLVGSYVHELQHALRLCRIEKTIEL